MEETNISSYYYLLSYELITLNILPLTPKNEIYTEISSCTEAKQMADGRLRKTSRRRAAKPYQQALSEKIT